MKQKVSIYFMLTGIVFTLCLILSNLLATKAISVFGWSATAGLIIFPVSYILNDAITEVWGYSKARLLIWTAFSMNFLAIVFMQVSVVIPPASYWDGQEAYRTAFSQAPRVACSSLAAFLTGSFVNSYIMSRMKVLTRGKGFGLRAIVSTLLGEAADSCIFFTVAFVGIFEWRDILTMIVVETILKSAYEVIVLPLTTIVVRFIKRKEGIDTFDTNISYNIFCNYTVNSKKNM